MLKYIQRAILWANVSNGNEDQVDQGPNPEATQTEELSEALFPLTQVKSVHSKATQCQAVEKDTGSLATAVYWQLVW